MKMFPPSIRTLILLGVCGYFRLSTAAPATTPARLGRALRTFISRQETQDPWDQGWVQRWASIGDSYAAGIGAGKLLDKDCARYDQSYPMILQKDETIGDGFETEFQFLACSGAVSKDMLDKQVPVLSDGQDIITISAGGNDVGLVDILNQCVYQFKSLGEDCAGELQATDNLIENQLPGNLDALYQAAKNKLSSRGTIYVTGYARFWGESTQCDEVTWSFWNLRPNKVYLKLENRQAMNNLVIKVNQKISEAVGRAGPQVIFVDYDEIFELMQARFCESFVTEPNPDRENSFFYQMDSVDENKDEPGRKRDGDAPEGSFEETIDTWIQQEMDEHPDWEFESPLDQITQVPSDPPSATDIPVLIEAREIEAPTAVPYGYGAMPTPGPELQDRQIEKLIPDGMKRVFHPRPLGHTVIARLVLWNMAHRRSEMLALPAEDRQAAEIITFDTCPVPQGFPENGDAPKCSDCAQGGGVANTGSCWGGDFDGRVCCSDENPFVCTQTGCNRIDGKCQGQYQGCACKDPPSSPSPPAPMCSESTEGWTCGAKCAGNIPCVEWCNVNCNYCFPVC